MNPKIKWLRDKITRMNMDGMIVTNKANIYYLIGVDAEGVLLLTRKENIYITDSRYIEMVNKTLTVDDGIIVTNVKDVSSDDYENFFLFCENVGFEENDITYARYKEYMRKYKINNFVETEHIIEKQRMIKDEEEIKNIEMACKITDDCFTHLLSFIKKGMTEKEIAWEIERYFLTNGAEGTSFETIVASGTNSSMPHAVPTDRKIASGDVITIDFGCKYKGYCSDMTRTIFVDFVQDYIKPVYDLVLKNQELTLKELYDGANIRILSKMVENDFDLNRFDLSHALGHGVGLDIHEEPVLSSRVGDMLLKENMVITDEPGIYIPGKFGVRIEDTVVITKQGAKRLTTSTKDYVVING
jgi:Xaa-Pro aminopeptidase